MRRWCWSRRWSPAGHVMLISTVAVSTNYWSPTTISRQNLLFKVTLWKNRKSELIYPRQNSSHLFYQKCIFSCEIVFFSQTWADVNTSWNSSFFRWLTAILYLLWLSFCLITSMSFALRSQWRSRVLQNNEGYHQDPHRHHHRSLITHGDSSSSFNAAMASFSLA